ncbi:response regulator transcription factor [Streptomyces inhibens]|uniref:response regulator transcription factor n=1 Tax=Streptomyces inhibens TaxID=2293571 RepID=UPI00402AB51F
MDSLLQRDAVRRAGLRQTGAELERLYRVARRESGRYGALEVVEGASGVLAAVRRLQYSARREVRVIALLIRPSGLFRALSNVFEALWRLAVPVSAAGIGAQVDARDRQILTLMASGATDEAIARRLGLGRRTVVRRVSALLTRLGATTRFQAGVQAARRGWL